MPPVFPREFAKVRLGNNNPIIVSCPISASKMQRQNNEIATMCKVSLTTFNSFGRRSAHLTKDRPTDTHGRTHLRKAEFVRRGSSPAKSGVVRLGFVGQLPCRTTSCISKCAHLHVKFLAILQYTSRSSTNVEVNSENLARDHFPRVKNKSDDES